MWPKNGQSEHASPGHSDWLMEKNTNKSSQLEHCPELSQESLKRRLFSPGPKLQSSLRAEWLVCGELAWEGSWGEALRGMWREKFLTLSGHPDPTIPETNTFRGIFFFSVIKLNHIQLPIFYNFWLKKDNFISFDLIHETTNSLSYLNKFKLSFWLLQLEESCPIHPSSQKFNFHFLVCLLPYLYLSGYMFV